MADIIDITVPLRSEMPCSRPSALVPMRNRIMEKNPMSVLDIGIGFGIFGFLAREYTDVRLGRYFNWKTRIDGIEIFEKYITHLQREIYNNIYIVKVHYTGRLQDGTVFTTTINSAALQFKIGQNQIIPGLENTIVSMALVESKTVKIPTARAFGPQRKEMIQTIDRNQFPKHLKPVVGQKLQDYQMDGQIINVTVTDISESTVTLDANHPLAGKDLIFDIQLVEIL